MTTRVEIINALINDFGYDCSAKNTVKNGVVMHGIVIDTGEDAKPVVYVDSFLSMETNEAAEKIVDAIRCNPFNVNTAEVTSKKYVLKNVLIGFQKDSDEDLIKGYSGFEGIEAYLFVKIGNNGSYKLKPSMLREIGVSIIEVWAKAFKNTCDNTQVLNLNEYLHLPSYGMDFMYIITSNDMTKGASSVLYKKKLKEIADKHGVNTIYVLPSSIHEMIVVASDCAEAKALSEMVKEINASKVAPEERLTDRSYTITF